MAWQAWAIRILLAVDSQHGRLQRLAFPASLLITTGTQPHRPDPLAFGRLPPSQLDRDPALATSHGCLAIMGSQGRPRSAHRWEPAPHRPIRNSMVGLLVAVVAARVWLSILPIQRHGAMVAQE